MSSELVVKEYLGKGIEFKVINGNVYANATQMCKIFNKQPKDWLRTAQTQRYIEALIQKANMPNVMISSIKGGNVEESGTWIYEKLVLKLAQWLDVNFEIWCDEQISTLIREGSVSLKPKTEEEMILELFPSTDMALVTMTANQIRENKALQIELAEEKKYISHVVHNEKYYITPTSMGNKFKMSAIKFNKVLEELNVQYKKGRKWILKKEYYGIGDYVYFQKPNGEWEKGTSLCYTNEGERVLFKLLTANGYEPIN